MRHVVAQLAIDPYLRDWLDLGLRLLHVIAAIACHGRRSATDLSIRYVLALK